MRLHPGTRERAKRRRGEKSTVGKDLCIFSGLQDSLRAPGLTVKLAFFLFTLRSLPPRPRTQLLLVKNPRMAAVSLLAVLPATPAAAPPRRSQQQRSSGSSGSLPSSSCSRPSIVSDGRRRRFSAGPSSLSSSALRAAPAADGPVVCLGEGLFGTKRRKRERDRERERENER